MHAATRSTHPCQQPRGASGAQELITPLHAYQLPADAAAAGPDSARLALIGAVQKDAVLQQLEDALGSWHVAPGQPAQPPGLPVDRAPTDAAGHTIYLVDQPGLEQAVVVLAEPGVQQADPDVYALDVLGSTMNGLGGARSRRRHAWALSGTCRSWREDAAQPLRIHQDCIASSLSDKFASANLSNTW